MYSAEQRYFAESSAPTIALMERAAREFTNALEEHTHGLAGRRIAVACGKGNNGGDGYMAAQMMAMRGGLPVILPLCAEDELRGDAQEACQIAREAGVPFADVWNHDTIERPDIWVDAAFGIGFSGELDERHQSLFARIERDRRAGALVAALDLPSGLDGLTGQAQPGAIRADLTITFQTPKAGHLLGDGPDVCGQLAIRDIGLNARYFPLDAVMRVEPSDLLPIFQPRKYNTHKGDYGHLLIIAGSRGMAGAAVLTASAALRMGAGLVTVACPESIVPIIQVAVPCAMCLPLSERDGALSADATPVIRNVLHGKDAIAIGPGLSRMASPAVLHAALEGELPAVIDADALNILSENEALHAMLNEKRVITPHPGEAARLLGRKIESPLEDARALREMGPIALYKGAATVICGERTYISASGSPGMATGGSGDVLTGMIGALLARGVPAERAAWSASELHGLAGEQAARALTETCMCAQDIIAYLPAGIRKVLER